MQNKFEVEKLPQPQIATRVAVCTVDQGTTNPVGAYPGGLAFLAKDAQCPIPAGKVFYPKLTNPLLASWVSRGSTPGEANAKMHKIRLQVSLILKSYINILCVQCYVYVCFSICACFMSM